MAKGGCRPCAAKLNSVLEIAEPLFVLSLMLAVVCGGVWSLFFGEKKGLAQAIKFLSENWQGAAILLLPLFFRSARNFLEQTEEFLGVKKRRQQEPAEVAKLPPGEGN